MSTSNTSSPAALASVSVVQVYNQLRDNQQKPDYCDSVNMHDAVRTLQSLRLQIYSRSNCDSSIMTRFIVKCTDTSERYFIRTLNLRVFRLKYYNDDIR